jgi:hypothetical protein
MVRGNIFTWPHTGPAADTTAAEQTLCCTSSKADTLLFHSQCRPHLQTIACEHKVISRTPHHWAQQPLLPCIMQVACNEHSAALPANACEPANVIIPGVAAYIAGHL